MRAARTKTGRSLLSPCEGAHFDLSLDEGKALVMQPRQVSLFGVAQERADDSRVTDGSAEGIRRSNTELHE